MDGATEERDTTDRKPLPAAGPRLRNQAPQFGSFRLSVPVLSAPVAGFTDCVFRGIVREFGGCGLIYTEMVSAGGWLSGNHEPERLRGVRDEVKPLGVQLWDREPAHVEEAARRLRDYGVSVIDLNFGCPKHRIMGKQGAGAKLLRDPDTVGRMVGATARGAGDIPVTAKIRLGPSRDQRTAVAVARAAAANGAAAVTVHGRSAGDGYGVPANRERIAEVVAAVDIPVIANGDVSDAKSALATLEETGAAAVMVARAALSRPWVFREIAAALRGDPIPAPPTLAQQRGQLLRHFADVLAVDGDYDGTVRMRKFACRYLSGVRGARAFRAAVSQAKDPADFHRIVEEHFPTDEDVLCVGGSEPDAEFPEERCA